MKNHNPWILDNQSARMLGEILGGRAFSVLGVCEGMDDVDAAEANEAPSHRPSSLKSSNGSRPPKENRAPALLKADS